MFLTTQKPANVLTHFLDDFFTNTWSESNNSEQQILTPHAYVSEQNGVYEVAIELPGVKKEDISVQIKDQLLVISATRKNTTKEFQYKRQFRLADEIDSSEISAKFENGLLTLQLGPKKQIETRSVTIQ